MRLAPETRSEIKAAIRKGITAKEVHAKYGISVPMFYVLKREVFGPARRKTATKMATRRARNGGIRADRRGRPVTVMPTVEVVPVKEIPVADGRGDILSLLSSQMKRLKKTDGLVVRNCGLPDCNKVKKEFGKRWKVFRAKKSAYRSDLFVWRG